MFNNFIEKHERNNRAPDDYTDAEGFLVCGKCGTRKQYETKFPAIIGPLKKVPIPCECKRAEQERKDKEAEQKERQRLIKNLRKDAFSNTEHYKITFSKDDGKQMNASNACRKYVENWEQMRSENVGLLIYGDVGTGKSFMAYCIANALIDRCVPVKAETLPRILNELQSSGDRNAIINNFQKYELVVIDDLGSERSTDYALEQMNAVIDAWYSSKKPLIITTNLSPDDIKKPENMAHKRIYDRIREHTLPVPMTGQSRRLELGRQKYEKYKDILGL